MVRRLHHAVIMIHTLDSPDDDKKHLSVLLRDVSDEHLKGLRMKTVRKIVLESKVRADAKRVATDPETKTIVPADGQMP